MTTPFTETPSLNAATIFASGNVSITVNLGVFTTAAIAKDGMRRMAATMLDNPSFMRRGRDLRGLGQTERKADEDLGTEGIYLMQAAYFHFMRLANVAVATTGLGYNESVDDPAGSGTLDLMYLTVRAQLEHLAQITGYADKPA